MLPVLPVCWFIDMANDGTNLCQIPRITRSRRRPPRQSASSRSRPGVDFRRRCNAAAITLSRETLCLRFSGMTLLVIGIGVLAFLDDAVDPLALIQRPT